MPGLPRHYSLYRAHRELSDAAVILISPYILHNNLLDMTSDIVKAIRNGINNVVAVS